MRGLWEVIRDELLIGCSGSKPNRGHGMRCMTLLIVACVLSGCDFDITVPSPVVTNTNTNTNTSTNTNTTTTVDKSDTDVAAGPTGGTPQLPTTGVLPLPAYGESVTLNLGQANPQLVQRSCQTTDGSAAWHFLDLLVRTLQLQDARWGYLCKDAPCSKVAADVVAYRASSGDTGIFIVDVLGNHCPGPQDAPTQVRWGVLPFETVRRWIGVRP